MEAKKLVGESPSSAKPLLNTDWKKKLIGARGILIFLRELDAVFWRSSLKINGGENKCVFFKRQNQMARSRSAGRSIGFGF